MRLVFCMIIAQSQSNEFNQSRNDLASLLNNRMRQILEFYCFKSRGCNGVGILTAPCNIWSIDRRKESNGIRVNEIRAEAGMTKLIRPIKWSASVVLDPIPLRTTVRPAVEEPRLRQICRTDCSKLEHLLSGRSTP